MMKQIKIQVGHKAVMSRLRKLGSNIRPRRVHLDKVNPRVLKPRYNFSTSINSKIIGAFLAIILIMGSVSIIPIVSYNAPISKYDTILNNIIAANTVISSAADIETAARNMMIKKMATGEISEKYTKEYDVKMKSLDHSLTVLENDLMSEESRSQFDGYKASIPVFIDRAQVVFSTDVNVEDLERSNLVDGLTEINGFINKDFKEIISAEISYSKKVRDELSNTLQAVLASTISILGVSLFVCMVLGTMIARSISKPVKRIAEVADRMATGDLTSQEIVINSRDELSLLGISFNRMTENLKTMISRMNRSSSEVQSVADQLYQSASQSSMTSEHIAESIQEVAEGAINQMKLSEASASTVDRMSLVVMTILDTSAKAKESSDHAHKATEVGNRSIGKVMQQINCINETISLSFKASEELHLKTKDIVSMLDVITTIAGQTNLLALNAAIEAARAGEHGRGFAVVADEVRKLAEESNRAAGKISKTISDIQMETAKMSKSMKRSMDEIGIGIDVTNEAGEAFEKISDSIFYVNHQIDAIHTEIITMNSSIYEITQVSNEVVQISKASASNTQEVASSTEELSAGNQEVLTTTHILTNMSSELKEMVNQFRLELV